MYIFYSRNPRSHYLAISKNKQKSLCLLHFVIGNGSNMKGWEVGSTPWTPLCSAAVPLLIVSLGGMGSMHARVCVVMTWSILGSRVLMHKLHMEGSYRPQCGMAALASRVSTLTTDRISTSPPCVFSIQFRVQLASPKHKSLHLLVCCFTRTHRLFVNGPGYY